jgi:hypothetical protein
MQGVGFKMTRIEKLIGLGPEMYRVDLVNFLHELEYCKSFEQYKELTYKEPREGLTDTEFNYVMTAGVIEFYAYRKGYDAPEWVYKDKYVLKSEWFALDDGGEYKARLFIYSPACFIWRNIFIDGETLIPI